MNLIFFLGVKITRIDYGFHLNPSKYIKDLVDKVYLNDSKPTSTHTLANVSLSKNDGKLLNNATQYRTIIGTLQYCILTILEISFVMNKLCEFLHSPTKVR